MFLDPGAHKNSSILTKNAYISPEESEVRIIWIATFIAFGLSVTSGVLLGLTLFHKYSNHEPVVVYPKIPKDQYAREFPLLHFAMILEDGTVIDISSNEIRSPSRGKLMKLPYSPKYHGYSDAQGVLYFIDGALRKPVVKYHKSLSNAGHKTIEMKGVWQPNNILFTLQSSVRIGKVVWLHEPLHTAMNAHHLSPLDGKSVVWSSRKQVLVQGPQSSNDRFCTASLNRTHVMVIGYSNGPVNGHGNGPLNLMSMNNLKSAIVYFYQNAWFVTQDIPMEPTFFFNGCTAVATTNRQGKQKVAVLFNLYKFPYTKIVSLKVYDIEKDQWSQVSSSDGVEEFGDIDTMPGWLLDIYGRVTYFTTHGTMQNYPFNMSWYQQDNQYNQSISTVIPYYV